jgi:hypothetical protein
MTSSPGIAFNDFSLTARASAAAPSIYNRNIFSYCIFGAKGIGILSAKKVVKIKDPSRLIRNSTNIVCSMKTNRHPTTQGSKQPTTFGQSGQVQVPLRLREQHGAICLTRYKPSYADGILLFLSSYSLYFLSSSFLFSVCLFIFML